MANDLVAMPLVTRWPAHTEEEIAAVAAVLRSGRVNYWTGVEGQTLEAEVSRAWGIREVLAVSNGTTALEAAIRGVHGPLGGGEIIVPARTFIATASAVVHAGGKPVVADIDPATLCVTAETLEARWTERTVGVIVVHYGGLPCPDMDNVVRWAMRRGVWIIEDAAHAHGAPGVGLKSHATAWSMCVGKIMSCGGEGGLVGCLDAGVAARARAYRDHGRYQLAGVASRDMSGAGSTYGEFKYTVEEFGSNLRMTEMQAVLARHALARLPGEVARRRMIARRYDEALGDRAMFTPEQRAEHVRYLYHARCEDGAKAAVIDRLNALGIPARFGGADDISKEPCFVKRGWTWDCPGAGQAGRETFSLPVYPTMTDADVGRVCAAVREVLCGA